MSRRWNAARYVSIMVVSLAPAGAFAQATASFRGVGDLPGGNSRNLNEATAVSPDGTVVVGHSWTGESTWRAFRWTATTGMEMLETEPEDDYSNANAASALGTIIVGWRPHYVPGLGGVSEAIVWENGTFRALAGVPLGSGVLDVTPDGAVIVGIVPTNLGQGPQQAFRYYNGALESLGSGPYGLGSEAHGVSADGSVVVGKLYRPNMEEAMRWTSETGMVGLGWLSDNPGSSFAEGVSSDGSTVVGTSDVSASESRAFRWKDGVMVSLGGLSTADLYGTAFATSSDGWTVVGKAQVNPQIAEAAFIWDPVFGMRRIADVLTNVYGVDLDGWDLRTAYSVSDDGQTIVGVGFNPDGNLEGWVATIPSWRQYTIIASDPPDGIIDARQDFSTSGLTRRGYDRVRLTMATAFNDPTTHGPLDVGSFVVEDSNGTAPEIVGVSPIVGNPTAFDVVFSDPITPGTWTTLSVNVERPDGTVASDRVRVGFLPGDVNGDGTSAPVDILELIDGLNGVVVPPLHDWQCDIDRSALCAPADILREIDLLNGARTSRPWNGVRLPPQP
jgi:probable HAF family extracellular repeat protein